MRRIVTQNLGFIIVMTCLLLFSANFRCLRILSGSMEPGIKTGAVVVAERRLRGDPEAGNVYAYDNGGNLVVHRLVAANDDGTYTFRGDANANPDLAPVKRDQIMGRAVVVINAAAALPR